MKAESIRLLTGNRPDDLAFLSMAQRIALLREENQMLQEKLDKLKRELEEQVKREELGERLFLLMDHKHPTLYVRVYKESEISPELIDGMTPGEHRPVPGSEVIAGNIPRFEITMLVERHPVDGL